MLQAIAGYETFQENALRSVAGLVGPTVGFAVSAFLLFMLREAIATTARRDLQGGIRVTLQILVGLWLASVLGYISAYGVLMTANGALLRRSFQPLECRVTEVDWVKPKHSATRTPRVRFTCAGLDGAELTGVRTQDIVSAPATAYRFQARARRGRLGVWLLDVKSLPWTRGGGSPG